MSTKNENGNEIADKVKVYKMSTDPNADPLKAFVNTAERDSLFEALDLAEAWLERA